MRRVHHIDGNSRNNAPENLRMIDDHDNRPRSHQDEIDRAVAEHGRAKHTPGPWRYVDQGYKIVSETAFEDYVDGDNQRIPKTIVTLYGAMGGDDTGADTRLMVAAPELAEALKEICELERTLPVNLTEPRVAKFLDACKRARAALQKAGVT